MPDCGCGGGKKCITKGIAEQMLTSFVRNNPQFNHKTKRATLMFIKKELKRLDCGCGCKGKKKFAQRYLTGGKLNDCPTTEDGRPYRNDGLTCVEPCNSDEVDDGLTCRKKCTGEQINDGLTCRNPIKSSMDPCPDGSRDISGTCWGTVRQDSIIDCIKHPATGGEVHTQCNPINMSWDGCCSKGLFGECYGCVRSSGGECNTWADPIVPCGLTTWNVDGITKELKDRNLRTWGGEVTGQSIRSKRITDRIDWGATADDFAAGFTAFMTGKLDYGALFDPEQNGVGAAFRKFGANTENAFKAIGERMQKAFDPNQNGVAKAFADFAAQAEKNLDQFGQDFIDKCKDPDMWVQVITIMAQVAGAILIAAIEVGTLGAGTPLAIGLGMALSAVGPAVKIIADAARGRPVDALDIVSLALAIIPPVPGVGIAMGAGIRKAIQYGNYAATAGRIIVAGVQVGQALGVVPSSCIANCSNPPDGPDFHDFEDNKDDDAILDLRPDENSYPYLVDSNGNYLRNADGSKIKDPNFISDDDWIARYKEDHPSSNASPTTKEEHANALAANTARTGGEEEEEPDLNFGGPGDEEEPDLNFGGPGDEEPAPTDKEVDTVAPTDKEVDTVAPTNKKVDTVAPTDKEVKLGPASSMASVTAPASSKLQQVNTPASSMASVTAPASSRLQQVGPPMTATEFLAGTPPPPVAPMSAKDFLAGTPQHTKQIATQAKFLAKSEPKSLPSPVIPQKQMPFLEGVSVNKNILPIPKKQYRVSTAPSIPLPPPTQVMISTIPKGKYYTPKDERYYLLRGGFADMTQYVIKNNLYE